MGVGTIGTTTKQAIDVEDYEEQPQRRLAFRLVLEAQMFERFPVQRGRMIADSNARLLEFGRQAEEERAHYEDQPQFSEIEIQRLHRILHETPRTAFE